MTPSDINDGTPAGEINRSQVRFNRDEVIEVDDVPCVEMPCCGFAFAATHTDATDGHYTCPCCDADQVEAALRAERDTLRYLLDAFDRYASIEGGAPYAGSPFQRQVQAAIDA